MTKAAWPREPSSRSTEAITTWTLAMPPLVAQAFWPLRTHSSFASSYLAVVRIAETSEPASGSEAQKAPTLTSSGVPKHCGIHSPICSGVPCPKIAATASEVPMIAMPMPASPQKSSSLAIGSVSPVSSAQNWPALRSCRGRSWRPPGSPARASPRARPTPSAAGRTTPSAKPWTHSRMSFWSWFSSRRELGLACVGGSGLVGSLGDGVVGVARRTVSDVICMIMGRVDMRTCAGSRIADGRGRLRRRAGRRRAGPRRPRRRSRRSGG